jgi:hypothetical protein
MDSAVFRALLGQRLQWVSGSSTYNLQLVITTVDNTG